MPEHDEHITAAPHTYHVAMRGVADGVATRDPAKNGQSPNIFVSMENTGQEAVIDPWIVVNGKRNWRSIDDILGEIVEPGMSDEEKAGAIGAFVHRHRYDAATGDAEVKDIVKMFNVYGYADAHDTAEAVSRLCRASGAQPVLIDHRMGLMLRPGETLIWEWENREKYHGYQPAPPWLCNGRLQYLPLKSAGFERWCDRATNVCQSQDALEPFDPERESEVVYSIRSPYVIVGGKVMTAGRHFTVEYSADGDHWNPLELDAFSERPQLLSLNRFFPPASPARYEYRIRFRGAGLTITRLLIETDLQMAPLSLPALEPGDNEVVYTDATPGERNVRITHGWYERRDVPAIPASPKP